MSRSIGGTGRRPDLGWMLPEGAPDLPGGSTFGSWMPPTAVLGRTSVGLGAVLLLFAVYQLWGTGLMEASAQRQRAAALTDRSSIEPAWASATAAGPAAEPDAAPIGRSSIEDDPIVSGASPAPAADGEPTGRTSDAASLDEPTPIPVLARPAVGEAIARLELPTLGVTKTVAHGVDRETLRGGPGHYPSSALPGQRGNVAIAGHRTTHGAPFADIDRLAPGDEIVIDGPAGRHVYRVEGQPADDGALIGHRIVDPSAVEVIADQGDDRLTLTACHPKFSARQRIIVTAVLVEAPWTTPTDAERATALVADRLDAAGASVAAPNPSAPNPVAAAGSTLPTGGITTPIEGPTTPPGEAEPVASATGAAPTEPAATVRAFEDSLGWQADEAEPTTRWATVTVLVLFAAWVTARFVTVRLVYPGAVLAAAGPLFAFFVHLDRLLPAY